jgi:hypothetical protein
MGSSLVWPIATGVSQPSGKILLNIHDLIVDRFPENGSGAIFAR